MRVLLIELYIRWMCGFRLDCGLLVLESLRHSEAHVCVCNGWLLIQGLVVSESIWLISRVWTLILLSRLSILNDLDQVILILVDPLRVSAQAHFIDLITPFGLITTQSFCHILTWNVWATLHMMVLVILCGSWSHTSKGRLGCIHVNFYYVIASWVRLIRFCQSCYDVLFFLLNSDFTSRTPWLTLCFILAVLQQSFRSFRERYWASRW